MWAVDKVRIPPPRRSLVYRRAQTKSLSALPLLVQNPLRILGANAGRKGAALSSLALMVSIKQLLNPGSFQIPISLTFSLWFGPSFAKYFTTRHKQAPELPLCSLDSFSPQDDSQVHHQQMYHQLFIALSPDTNTLRDLC